MRLGPGSVMFEAVLERLGGRGAEDGMDIPKYCLTADASSASIS